MSGREEQRFWFTFQCRDRFIEAVSVEKSLLKTKGCCEMVTPVRRPAWHPWWGAGPVTRRSPRARSGPGSHGSDRSACPVWGTATSPLWPWSSESPPPPAWEEPRELRTDKKKCQKSLFDKDSAQIPDTCTSFGFREQRPPFVFRPFHYAWYSLLDGQLSPTMMGAFWRPYSSLRHLPPFSGDECAINRNLATQTASRGSPTGSPGSSLPL